MKKTKVTAKDVAKLAGVSPATVSLILNGKSGSKFSEKTCRRVINACAELGYAHKGTFESTAVEGKILVALLPTYSNVYYVQLVDTMQRRAKELGYTLLAFDTFREITQETRIMQICNHLPFSGIFFLYPPENDVLMQVVNWSKPVIHIYDKGAHAGADTLKLGGLQIGELIGEHLISLGHERIAFLSSTFETKQVTRLHRLEGLRSVYRRHGYDPDRSILPCSPESELSEMKHAPEYYDLGYLIAKQLLERKEDVTAFVGANDNIAIGAMDAILDAGKKIPKDYSVCGCDNTYLAKFHSISLTSVESYAKQAGQEAVDMMVRKIETDALLSPPEDTPDVITSVEYFPKLIVRKSTGPRAKKR